MKTLAHMNRNACRAGARFLYGMCTLVAAPVIMAGAAIAASPDPAPNYPTRPIRFVAPTSPGGANDILPRILGARMTQNWGQQVVVDLRPGAGGIVGTEIAARAAPDGYTLLIVANGYALNPYLNAKLPYDTLKDFERVSLFTTAPLVLVVPQQSPIQTVQELVNTAKAKPGQFNYATSGLGSGGWLSIELLKKLANLSMTHIPYKGAGQATAAVLGNEVNMLFTSPLAAAPYIKSGRIRALAVTSPKRVPSMDSVPAMNEFIPGYEVLNFFGILVPAGTPRPIITKLNTEINRITSLPDVKDQFAALGFEPVHYTPEQFTTFLRAEMSKWSAIIREAGIKAEQ
jgi:tripartite-type tricarboxylate transporter receptor subunit TctC